MNIYSYLKVVLLGFSLFFANSCKQKVELADLKRFVAVESYPPDIFLDTIKNKKALIIVAHDDDDCAMSGTIALLSSRGWQIKQLSFQQHFINGSTRNPATIICQGEESILKDGNYRRGLDTIARPYWPITYQQIEEQFLKDKVSDTLIQKVNDFGPSVIFTLDDIKGGYGHPEHIFISKLTKELFEAGRLDVQRIYQSVFTPHMEREIVHRWLAARMKKWNHPNISAIADSIYGIDGMPTPNVEIDIFEAAESKMRYLKAYPPEVRKNLRKFLPYYEQFDGQSYFGLFRKEYFRVISTRTEK